MAMVNKTRLKFENIAPILVSACIWNKNPLGRKFGSMSYRRFTIIEDISLKFSVEDDDFHLNTSSLKISRNKFTFN